MRKTTTAVLIWLALVVFVFSATVFHYRGTLESTQTINVIADHRLINLRLVFVKYKCEEAYAQNYIQAADKYKIDFRILPAISIIESGCGKHYLYNNYFGWGSSTGLQKFESIPASIDFVTRQIAESQYYQNKTLKQLLEIYNSGCSPELTKGCKLVNSAYASNVIRIMDQISNP